MKVTIDLGATEFIQDQIPSGGVICFYRGNEGDDGLIHGTLLNTSTALKIRKMSSTFSPFVVWASKELLDEGS